MNSTFWTLLLLYFPSFLTFSNQVIQLRAWKTLTHVSNKRRECRRMGSHPSFSAFALTCLPCLVIFNEARLQNSISFKESSVSYEMTWHHPSFSSLKKQIYIQHRHYYKFMLRLFEILIYYQRKRFDRSKVNTVWWYYCLTIKIYHSSLSSLSRSKPRNISVS